MPDPTNQRLAGHHRYLIVAIVAAGLMAVLWLGASVLMYIGIVETPLNKGLMAILAMVGAFAGTGYLVRSAEARVVRHLAAQVADGDNRYQEGYAAGYVDGAAGREAATRKLHSV